MPLQCIIVDDYQPFLKVARAKLEQQGIAVVGVATNGAEALRQARGLSPDVLLRHAVPISCREEVKSTALPAT
jgi:CheY-like chemotaxis protein